jgi:tetratricopeptide (TPR) repeat protein
MISRLRKVTLALCVATTALFVGELRSDEIDEILNIEKAVESARAPLPESVVAPVPAAPLLESVVAPVPAAPLPAASKPAAAKPMTAATLIASQTPRDREIFELREENGQLRELLETQETRHREELFFAHYNMGCVYKASRQYTRAQSEFMKALQIKEDDAAVHYNLGILYDDDLDMADNAGVHYRRFLELATDDGDIHQVQEWLALLDE